MAENNLSKEKVTGNTVSAVENVDDVLLLTAQDAWAKIPISVLRAYMRLGVETAYDMAVKAGYKGTEDEYWALTSKLYELLDNAGSGFVKNLADDEDIKSVNNLLKLADKSYDASSYSGLGRTYVRKNVTDSGNILTQAMITAANYRYVIQYDYDLNGATVTVPSGCTLVMEGGSLKNGTLVGSNTAVEAPLYKIFDTTLKVTGTWSTEGHAEWWGAKPTTTMVVGSDDNYDNSAAIQAAFDSDFGVMKMGGGYYYCASTVTLKKLKTLELAGRGMSRSKDSTKNTFTTVIWTKNDIDLMVFDLNYNDTVTMPLINQDLKALKMSGGELDVSRSADVNGQYTHDCLKIYLPVGWLNGAQIDVSVVGPIGYVSSTSLTVATAGNGIHFTDKGNLYNSRKGAMYVNNITANVSGFGNGILIDYNSAYADMTSTKLNLAYSLNCYRHIYAPSRAFNGGWVRGIIQSADFNDSGLGAGYCLVDGDFTNALVDVYPFDAGRTRYLNIVGTNVRLGQWLMSLVGTAEVLTDASKATFVSSDASRSIGYYGTHCLHGLMGLHNYVELHNYVHTIDDDLLGIERAYPSAVSTVVTLDGTTMTRKDAADADAWTLIGDSPFDTAIPASDYHGGYLRGVVLDITGGARTSGASKVLVVSTTISHTALNAIVGTGDYLELNALAIHLKGDAYAHFNNLKVEVNGQEHYNGAYATVGHDNSLSDVVIPITGISNTTGTDKTIVLTLTGWVDGASLGWNHYFSCYIEGVTNMKPARNILTSAGGDLGAPLYYGGKKLIIPGAKTTAERQAITNIAAGACIFDSTLKKPLWYTGSGWVDATGTNV